MASVTFDIPQSLIDSGLRSGVPPQRLADRIVRALKAVVPVRTGRLKRSIARRGSRNVPKIFIGAPYASYLFSILTVDFSRALATVQASLRRGS